MHTIRKQILYPFLIILILLPITILILFNIVINFSFNNYIKKELQNTVKTMQSITNSYNTNNSSDEIQSILKDLSAALTASKFTGNTEFFILDKDNNIIYPRNLENTIMSNELQNSLINNPIGSNSSIQNRYIQNINYYLYTIPLTQYEDLYDLTILFVSNTSTYKEIIKTTNIILLILFIISIFISVLISIRISTKFSKPIIDACYYAVQIGNGDFICVPENSTSTEMHQFYKSLNQMSQRLKAYDNTQKQFLQNASHELRTPLMSIQGYAEGIENNIISDYKSAATIIKKESIRLNSLVTELLTLSRIENQTYKHDFTLQDVSNLLLDYIQRINGLAMKENIEIKHKLQENLCVKIDESLFSQSIINIISNCIRYAKNIINIETFAENNNVIITISDDGEGFSNEDLPHLFERFYKGNKGNFGLGLAISYSAIKYMKGDLLAYNDNGATFKIILSCA